MMYGPWVLLLAVGLTTPPEILNPPPSIEPPRSAPRMIMMPGIPSQDICEGVGQMFISGPGLFVMHWCIQDVVPGKPREERPSPNNEQ